MMTKPMRTSLFICCLVLALTGCDQENERNWFGKLQAIADGEYGSGYKRVYKIASSRQQTISKWRMLPHGLLMINHLDDPAKLNIVELRVEVMWVGKEIPGKDYWTFVIGAKEFPAIQVKDDTPVQQVEKFTPSIRFGTIKFEMPLAFVSNSEAKIKAFRNSSMQGKDGQKWILDCSYFPKMLSETRAVSLERNYNHVALPLILTDTMISRR